MSRDPRWGGRCYLQMCSRFSRSSRCSGYDLMLSPSCSRQSEKPLKTESQRVAPPTAVSTDTGEREESQTVRHQYGLVPSTWGTWRQLTWSEANEAVDRCGQPWRHNPRSCPLIGWPLFQVSGTSANQRAARGGALAHVCCVWDWNHDFHVIISSTATRRD